MGILEILIVLCILLWAAGMMTSFTFGGLLHLLIVVAVIVLVVRLVRSA